MPEPCAARFRDRTVVVTGGASGLGYATAQRVLAEGGSVALLDLGGRVHEALVSLGEPARVRAYDVDVTDAPAVAGAVASVVQAWGRIDGLVTSAGISRVGSVLDTDLGAWQHVLDVNLTGTFVAIQAVARHMVERRSGRLVLLASITGSRVWTARAAYAASKGGVIALMRSCAIDLAAHGITVNSVSPGPIETPQTAGLHGKTIRAAIEREVPMARYGAPAEVAAAIAYLLSDDAGFVTGHDLIVDGGLTAAAILYDRAASDAEMRRTRGSA